MLSSEGIHLTRREMPASNTIELKARTARHMPGREDLPLVTAKSAAAESERTKTRAGEPWRRRAKCSVMCTRARASSTEIGSLRVHAAEYTVLQFTPNNEPLRT